MNEMTTTEQPGGLTAEQAALLQEAGAPDDFAQTDLIVPRLRLLQSTSRQLKRAAAEYIETAREGQFFLNIPPTLFDEVEVLPLLFRHDVREYDGSGVAAKMLHMHGGNTQMLAGLTRNAKGNFDLPNGHELRDAAFYYLLVRNGQVWQPCVMFLQSTQWRMARQWNTMMQFYTVADAQGRTYNPPTYARSYVLTSRTQSDEENTWNVVNIAAHRSIFEIPGGMELFARCRELREHAAQRTIVAAAEEEETGGEPMRGNRRRSDAPRGDAPLDDDIPF